jgi:hypothetical protein
MRRLCSWCGEILTLGSTLPLQTTHGVCNPCARELLASIAGDSSKGMACRETKMLQGAHSESCEAIGEPSRAPVIQRQVSDPELRRHAKP